MLVLGIESSCDETCAAIVDDKKNILSNITKSQIDIHKEFGGVVPEIAARSHVEIIDKVILKSLKDANIKIEEIDAIAATSGPGLIGGLIVGLMAGKTLASVLKKPFLSINHLEAHILTPRLTNDLEFPYLAILLSGGHCQILLAEKLGTYHKIGQTIDDALGESFDKVAQMLGLEYPGGPKIEQQAKLGDENKYIFPKPLLKNDFKKQNQFNFSFSGLKTAVRNKIEELTGSDFVHLESCKSLSEQEISDICASFQKTVTQIIKDRIKNILTIYFSHKNYPPNIVLSGGVAANKYIFTQLSQFTKEFQCKLIAPPLNLCTDNAAMIAWNGVEKMKNNNIDNLSVKPRAKWLLEELQHDRLNSLIS